MNNAPTECKRQREGLGIASNVVVLSKAVCWGWNESCKGHEADEVSCSLGLFTHSGLGHAA
jgi:hypothetical protein